MEKIKTQEKSSGAKLIFFVLGCLLAYVSIEMTINLFKSYGTTPEEKELYQAAGFSLGILQYLVYSAALIYYANKNLIAAILLFAFSFSLLIVSIFATLGFQTVVDNKKTALTWKTSKEYQRLSTLYTDKMDSIAQMKADKASWRPGRYRTKRQEIQAKINAAQDEAQAISNKMAQPPESAGKNTAKASTSHLSRILGLANKDLNFWFQIILALIIEIGATVSFAVSNVVNWRIGTFLANVSGLAWLKNRIVSKLENRNTGDFLTGAKTPVKNTMPEYKFQPVSDNSNIKPYVTAENVLEDKKNDPPLEAANDNTDVSDYGAGNENVFENLKPAANENVFRKKKRNSKRKVLNYDEVKKLIQDDDVNLTPGCRPIMRVAGVGYPVAKRYMERLLREDVIEPKGKRYKRKDRG